MQELSPPKNNLAKILLDLINGKAVSEQDYRMNGFRQRLSDIRNDLKLKLHRAKEYSKNEHNRQIWYYRHFFLTDTRKAAKKIYVKINRA